MGINFPQSVTLKQVSRTRAKTPTKITTETHTSFRTTIRFQAFKFTHYRRQWVEHADLLLDYFFRDNLHWYDGDKMSDYTGLCFSKLFLIPRRRAHHADRFFPAKNEKLNLFFQHVQTY